MRRWTLIFTVLIIIVLLLVTGLAVIELESKGDDPSLFSPLFDFCWDQLRPVVNGCGNWAIEFDDLYGEQATICLGLFDSDSLSLLVCLESVVEG